MAQATPIQRTLVTGALHSPVEGRLRSRPRRVRWRRLVVVALSIPTLVVVLYLVVANVVLQTRLLRNLVGRDPTALRLDYQSAYSIVPGRVHVEGLSVRGRQRSLEWLFTLDRADVSVSLVDLLHKRFHATRVRSTGFAIRVRLRLERAQAIPNVLAALPPIDGFADPPLLDAGPEPPPLTDADYNLWMVHLEDVEVEHVREVWIHTVRSEGDSRLRGRWLFRPARWLDVGPATVDANGVDIFYGSHPLTTGVRGSFGATVHPFDPRQAKGLAVFDHVSHRRHRALRECDRRAESPAQGGCSGLDRSLGEQPGGQERRGGERGFCRGPLVGERCPAASHAADERGRALRGEGAPQGEGCDPGDRPRLAEHGRSDLGRRPVSDADPRCRRRGPLCPVVR
jgi:hypothetical protein